MRVAVAELALPALDVSPADGVILFVGHEERPLRGLAGICDWRLCGALSRVVRSGFFTGAQGEALLMPGQGRFAATKVFALGLGANTVVEGRTALRKAFEVSERAGVRVLGLSLESLPVEREDGVRLFLELARHAHFEAFVLFGDSRALRHTLGPLLAVGEQMDLPVPAPGPTNHSLRPTPTTHLQGQT